MALSTNAAAAYNTIIKVCTDANGTSPTAIAETRNIKGKFKSTIQDVTTQRGARERQKIVTLIDVDFECVVNWLQSSGTHDDATGLHYIWKNGLERTYQFIESDTSTIYQFNALITNIDHDRAVDGARQSTVQFTSTGSIDLSA